MTTTVPVGLRVRKLALDDGLERVKRFDPVTGEGYWAHPTTGDPLPKQVAGVVCENDGGPPPLISVSTSYVDVEPWIELVDPRPVHKPGGPLERPWATTHTFVHCDELVLHLADGDVRYRVVHQPDKYDDETGEPSDQPADPTTHVDWFYVAELVED
jgi:hypothetical protein